MDHSLSSFQVRFSSIVHCVLSLSVLAGAEGWDTVLEGHPVWCQGVSAGAAKDLPACVTMGTCCRLRGQGAAAVRQRSVICRVAKRIPFPSCFCIWQSLESNAQKSLLLPMTHVVIYLYYIGRLSVLYQKIFCYQECSSCVKLKVVIETDII